MKHFRFIFLIVFSTIILPKLSFGQDTARYKVQENFKREIVINDKRFRVYNNWFSGGGGPGYNSQNPYVQLVIGVNMNFHIHQYYFRLGGMLSGDNFATKNNFQLHAGWIPYRKETEKYNLAFVTAVSYSTGYKYIFPGHIYDNIHPYAEYGGYAEIQWIKKLFFDAGYGGALFVNVNAKNTILGLRFDVFLSGAYKGYVKGKGPL